MTGGQQPPEHPSRMGQPTVGLSPNHPRDEKDSGTGGLPEVPEQTERQSGGKFIDCVYKKLNKQK